MSASLQSIQIGKETKETTGSLYRAQQLDYQQWRDDVKKINNECEMHDTDSGLKKEKNAS